MGVYDVVGKPKKQKMIDAKFPSAKGTGVQTDTKKIIGGSIKKKKAVGHAINPKNKIKDII